LTIRQFRGTRKRDKEDGLETRKSDKEVGQGRETGKNVKKLRNGIGTRKKEKEKETRR
jgi:hypothetical protein